MLTLKRKKVEFDNSRTECGKRCSNICIGLKKTCLGVLDRGERDKYNEAGLKEEE